MAFGPEGKLYVAEFGTQTDRVGKDGKPLRPGRLVMIEGDTVRSLLVYRQCTNRDFACMEASR